MQTDHEIYHSVLLLYDIEAETRIERTKKYLGKQNVFIEKVAQRN